MSLYIHIDNQVFLGILWDTMSEIKLLTPEETAQILGLSPKTIKDWCRAGYIKAVKVGKGGIWRIPESELDRLIKERSGKREVRKIAIALSKGGVGKTTTAVNLAAGLAIAGNKVLVIDTDTQGQVAPLLGVKPPTGLSDVLGHSTSLENAIYKARENLDILAGGSSLAATKISISKNLDQPQFALAVALEPLDGKYDYIIIDTAPSWDILNLCVLFFAHEVLVPISLEVLSVQGLVQFQDNLDAVAKYQQNLELKYILPTFLDNRVKRSNEIYEQLKATYSDKICDPIHYNSKIAEAPAKGQPIFEFDPNSIGADDYWKLVDRVKGRR